MEEKKNNIKDYALGVVIGASVGVLMFFVENPVLDETVRLVICFGVIILSPRIFKNLNLDYLKGRWGMAAAVVISVAAFMLTHKGA